MNLSSRFLLLPILVLTYASLVAAQSGDITPKKQNPDSSSQPKMERKQDLLDDAVAQVCQLNVKRYHLLLRESSRLLPPQCLKKPWSEINGHFVDLRLPAMESWENGDAIHRYYLLKKNVIAFSGCSSTDLWILLSAMNSDRPNYPVKPGAVYAADVAIVSTVSTSYHELIDTKPYPADSVLDTVLKSDDVKSIGATWPIVHRIYVHYGYIANRWSEHNPNGFHVTVEFVTSLDQEVAGKRINFTVPSGLDPLRTLSGQELVDAAFVSSDTLGAVESGGGNEWWHGEPHVVEANRKKYLKSNGK